jgi:hypothetical protein
VNVLTAGRAGLAVGAAAGEVLIEIGAPEEAPKATLVGALGEVLAGAGALVFDEESAKVIAGIVAEEGGASATAAGAGSASAISGPGEGLSPFGAVALTGIAGSTAAVGADGAEIMSLFAGTTAASSRSVA